MIHSQKYLEDRLDATPDRPCTSSVFGCEDIHLPHPPQNPPVRLLDVSLRSTQSLIQANLRHFGQEVARHARSACSGGPHSAPCDRRDETLRTAIHYETVDPTPGARQRAYSEYHPHRVDLVARAEGEIRMTLVALELVTDSEWCATFAQQHTKLVVPL